MHHLAAALETHWQIGDEVITRRQTRDEMKRGAREPRGVTVTGDAD